MFLYLGDEIINTAHIVKIEEATARGAPAPEFRVHLADGSTRLSKFGGRIFEELCGQIVPAAPGLWLHEAFREGGPDGKDMIFLRTAVVAFRLHPGDDTPIPISLRGEAPNSSSFCYGVEAGVGGRIVGQNMEWDNLGEFQDYCAKECP